MRASFAFQLLVLLLPWPLRRALLRSVLGFRFGEGARIGLSLVGSREVELGPGARIGHGNLCKGLSTLCLGAHATIGNLNWITAFPAGNGAHFAHVEGRDPSLRIGDHAALTNRHYVDCTGGCSIGRFTTVAGWGSQFISHSFDLKVPRQDAGEIRIGEYCFVGSRAILLKGASLPGRSILSAGSVLSRGEAAGELGLYRGNPAERVSELDPALAYFHRDTGFIR